MSIDVTQFAEAAGRGSVASAPDLPPGFAEQFSSRIVPIDGHRQHVVVGGEGPPLLLVHGWPESWYAWRLVMPALARDFTVVAVDQRGMGLTDKPADGYDAGTLAADLVALMDALGFDRFAIAGHDTGMVIAYAVAADHPDRVAALVAAEIPGAPGVVPAPPLFVPAHLNDKLWHIPFNRAGRIAEQLIEGHEAAFFGYEFAVQGGPPLPQAVIDYYVGNFADATSLSGGLGFYREWDATMAQNGQRATTQADHAGAGRRRCAELRRARRPRHAAGRGRRRDLGHRRRGSLAGGAGTPGPAVGHDGLPRAVPGRAPAAGSGLSQPEGPRVVGTRAVAASSRRDPTPSLVKTFPRCHSTVRALM